MSYSFDGVNDRMTGTFTSTYAQPITIAAFIKVTAHPAASQVILGFGNSSSSINDSIDIRTAITDDQWGCRCTNSAGTSNTSLAVANFDDTWFGIVGHSTGDTHRAVDVPGAQDQELGSIVVAAALQFVKVGEGLNNSGDFTGLIAEVAMWDVQLSSGEIDDYQSGLVATEISPSNLIGYWPLSASGSTQNNLGVDTAGDLTVTGAIFNADHPTITSGDTTIAAKARFYQMLRTGAGG